MKSQDAPAIVYGVTRAEALDQFRRCTNRLRFAVHLGPHYGFIVEGAHTAVNGFYSIGWFGWIPYYGQNGPLLNQQLLSLINADEKSYAAARKG